MANVAIYNEGQTPENVIEYLLSVNTPNYEGRSDVVINPDVSGLSSIPVKYWKHVAGAIVEMTQAEKDAVDANEAVVLDTILRSGAKALFDGQVEQAQALRALVYVLLDEINILRQRDRDRAIDIANSNNLSDVKAFWAARSELTDRTLAQAKTAIKTEIDAGTVDE